MARTAFSTEHTHYIKNIVLAFWLNLWLKSLHYMVNSGRCNTVHVSLSIQFLPFVTSLLE